MSVAAEPRSHAPYAEPDEYINYQLRKTQTAIKRIDMLTAAVVAITVLIGYVLLFVLSDHWLFEGGVGGTARVLMFLPVIGFVGWLIGAKVIWPALRTVSGLYAARTLEASSTEFRSGLLNLVDLKQAGRDVSPLILATMEKRAAVTLAKFNVDDAIDKRPLLRTLYVLFGIVVVFCAYSIFSPKKLGPSVLRAIVPFTNVTPATQTEILEVKPGDAKLRAGGILPVSVQLRGEVPADVTLLFTTADRRFVDEPVQLGATTDPNLFEGTLGNDEHGLLQSFTYHVVAGDARSPEYRVEIIAPPSATVTEVRYDYPEYTELDSRTQMGGAIDVWERAAIAISAATNVPVKRAEFELADTEDFSAAYPGSSVKIADGKRLTISWRADPRQADGKFPKFYRIKVWDAEETPDPKPAVYPINVRVDQPPQVVMIEPTTNLEMPANATIPLVVSARDPDFKLARIRAMICIDREGEKDQPVEPDIFGPPSNPDKTDDAGHRLLSPKGLPLPPPKPDNSYQKQVVGPVGYEFSLADLRLNTGDKLRLWVEAQDNRLPTHNLAKTPPIEITIKGKVTKEEAKKQLEDQKKEQQQRLDEANKNNDQANDRNEQQPDKNDQNQDDNKVALIVRLIDLETNQQLDVNDYSKKLGLKEPLFRGFVLSECAGPRWGISTIGSPDGDRRKVPPTARDQLAIRHEIRQMPNPMFEELDRGILHAMPQYRDCRLDQERAQVIQGRVTSALYREKPAEDQEIKYLVYSEKPPRNERLPFPLATLENNLNARDRDYYCKLPDGLNDLRKFARGAAGNRDGDQIEIAKRLLASLDARNGFSYDKNTSMALPSVATVEDFLRQKQGDCKQFNSALALMLREFKIPSRLVLGLKGGQIENGEFVVRWPGHAWVEAYLNGHWLILDATPAGGSGGADQQPRDANDPNDPNEGEQLKGNQPKDDPRQQDDKNSKGKDGDSGKTQKGGEGKKSETGSEGKSDKPGEKGNTADGKSGKQSLKNDGTQDQEVLEKIAQGEKKNGRLQKKDQQSSSSPQKTEPQENSHGDKAGEKPGDKAGEKPGDKAGEKPGDKAGEKPGDKAGEKPGDKAGEKPGDKAGEKPGDKAGEKPGDKAGEKPGDKAGEKPGDKAGEKPGDKAGEKPGDKSGEKPGDKAGEKPGDKAGEKPGDKAGEKPGDKAGEKPGDKSGEKPGDKSGEKPGDKAGEKPGDKAGEKPGDKAGEKPGDKAGEKPGDKAGEKPGDKAGEKPGDKAGEKPGDKAGEKPGDKAGEKPGDKGASKRGKGGSKSGQPGSTPGEGSPSQSGEPGSASSSSGSSSNSGEPEDANEEFTKEAANLTLKRLGKEIERGEADQELLDQLGWTPEKMKKFVERAQPNLEGIRDNDTPHEKALKRQYEEMVKNLSINEKTQRRNDTNNDKQTGDGFSPMRRLPPPDYRESFESYTKSLSKKKAAETPKK